MSDIFKHCYDTETSNYTYAPPPFEIHTRGKDGLRYRAPALSQNKWKELPAFGVDGLVDAAGSGDWLTAGLIHKLGQKNMLQNITNKHLRDALYFGQCLSALNCLYSGARGLMYNISPTSLNTLVLEVMSSKNASHISGKTCPVIKHRDDLSSRCKICLCKV